MGRQGDPPRSGTVRVRLDLHPSGWLNTLSLNLNLVLDSNMISFFFLFAGFPLTDRLHREAQFGVQLQIAPEA